MNQEPLWLATSDAARPRGGRLHARSHDTEEAAATLTRPRTGTQRALVLERLRQVGAYGSTDFENSEALGLFRHVAGTRREELIRDGWPIADTGRRRPTDRNSPAVVWMLDAERAAELQRDGGL